MIKKLFFISLTVSSLLLVPFIAQAETEVEAEDTPTMKTIQQMYFIARALEQLSAPTGSYEGQAETARVIEVFGDKDMKSVTGGNIIISSGTKNTYKVTIPLTVSICDKVKTRAASEKRVAEVACNSDGVLTYTISK